MKNDLTYYMKLRYKTVITPIPEDEGGGFEASIPQLGSYAFIGEGETSGEALKDLEKTKREYFKEFMKKGIEIPEPDEPTKEFRGDFLLRMPKFLHRDLYLAAKENEVSLNQYMNYLLTKSMTLDSLEKKIGELAQEVKQLSKKVTRVPEADIVEWIEQPSQPAEQTFFTRGVADFGVWHNAGCVSAYGVGITSDVGSFYPLPMTFEKKKKIDLIETLSQQEE